MNMDAFKQRIQLKNSEIHLSSAPELTDGNTALFAQQVRALLEGKLPLDEAHLKGHVSTDSTIPFSLSDIQYAYVIGRNPGVELGGRSSSFYIEIDVEDADIDALTASLNHVISLHPMLRAVLSGDGQQKVLEQVSPYQIETLDVSGLEKQEQQAALAAHRHELETTLLPLDKAPSFVIKAIRLDTGLVRLAIYFDLIFVDMHSVYLVLQDWFDHYQNGTVATQSRPSFSDYLNCEALLTDEAQGRKDVAYWEDKLNKLPQAPEMPLKKAPSLLSQPQFCRLSKSLPATLIEQLRVVAHNGGMTLETLFLGAYAEVVRQWSKAQNFTLTVTQMSRRPYFEGVEHTVGNFLQPVLLPVEGGKSETFSQRLLALQSSIISNRLHSSHNSIKVLRALTKQSQSNRAASFPVVFSNTLDYDLQEVVKSPSWPGIHSRYMSNTTPQLWLENQLTYEQGQVTINWNYVEELFPDGMIQEMQEAYLTLLNACASDAKLLDKQGEVVDLPEQDARARQQANDTEIALNPTLLQDLVLNAAHKYPDQVALVQGDRQVTYSELLNKAQWIANQIGRNVNICANDIVAVTQQQGPDLVIAIVGVLLSGAAYVAIDPNLPSARKVKLLERCDAKGVVGDTNTLADFTQISDVPHCDLFGYDATQTASTVSHPVPELDDLAYVIFTSGSTGEPKGVMISHRNAANTVIDINRRFNVSSDDAVLSVAPAGFDLSVYDYFGVLGAGGRVVFGKPESAQDPLLWYEELVAHDVTIWNSVPAPMKALVDKNTHNLSQSKLRLVLMSGDWIPVDLPDRIKEVLPHCEVISLGGATEGSIWSIFYPIQAVDDKWSSIPYGKPLANQRFHVLNEWLSHCPRWVTGELYIAGEGVAQGYLGDKEKTAQRFFDHPVTGERLYKTGDLGKYIADGYIEILGREDNQVKINGYRVELGEVEVCLLDHEHISHVVVGAPAHPRTGQRHIVAWIVSDKPQAELDHDALQTQLRNLAQRELPNYMIPSYYIVLDAMPLTSNGKISHNELPSPWQDLDNEAEQSVQAGNEIEAALLDIWIKQLQHDSVDVTSGFFDIGGDSLHAVALIGTIREQFGINTDTEQEIVEGLFMNSNIQYFAQLIHKDHETEVE
ncbi:non-ribosomal peptide synthetase [Pseudoalteromonas luteoviolacea]|uniref:non-ribosomal peptide synthetase n=1 Tax=Pseudoalteromonas luteoviolacea TaxID=43657 RepID=UPI001B36A1A7|nr:non-ribosomal peptide synthetase [Pseudoalteromonas luteoviolacea]MBQ4839744.1 amino acid adenylation domain-containing protein [Pseudoalteromonas luteoviolacea]